MVLQSKVILSTNYALQNKIPFCVHQGGTYSGKTFGINKSLIEYAFQTPKKTIDIIGQSVPHLTTGAKKDFETILELENIQLEEKKQEKLYKFPNGSAIRFLSVDKLGKAKGGKRDVLFANECNEFSYQIIRQLMLRTNDTVILDYNPTGLFWWQTKLLPTLEKANYRFYRTTYKDNPSISQKKIKEIEGLKNEDEQLYNIYALGITGKLEGLIFPNFSIVEEMPNIIGNGLDFGFNSPSALVHCGYEDHSIYLDEGFYETGLSNADIAERITNKKDTIADSAEPKSIAEIQKLIKGKIYGADKSKGSVISGIKLIKKFANIYVTKRSTNIIKEFNNYKWKVDRNGDSLDEPVKAFDHAMDGFRYFVTYHFDGGKKQVSTFEIENNPDFWNNN